MAPSRFRHVKLLLIPLVVIALWTAGSGFYRSTAAGNDETYEGLKLFSDVIELIEKNYVDEVEPKELIIKAIHGMVNSLDPHSAFMPPEAFEELKVDTQGAFGGIGIVITAKQGIITVISPIQGTPAYEAGIKAADRIIKVDGESTEGMALWEAVKKMRGPKGTKVVITIAREGEAEPIDYELIRDIIPIESIKYATLQDGYGYIWITNFNENTTNDLKKALGALFSENDPLKGIILDLRDNPGGLLNQAVETADLFLDSGTIVSIKARLKRSSRVFTATAGDMKNDYAMVVLINGGSASASEIVAGALKDNKRALILGTTSFGKGSVQTVETLRDGYGLKYTIARYYTPSGQSIQAQGVTPDIVVAPGTVEDTDVEETGFLKEKDLKNHLEAEPMADDSETLSSGEHGEPEDIETQKLRMKRVQSKHIPLEVESLKKDRQIMRALEILRSYDILKTTRS